MTEAERKLWALLRRKKLSGFRFRRQAPIGQYIADFEARLIIELDGNPHTDEHQIQRDAERTAWLKAHGCRVIRFWNVDVFKHPVEVTEAIYDALTHPPSVPASCESASPVHLPPQGGKAGRKPLSENSE